MVQEIITYIIIAAAIFLTLRQLFRTFSSSKSGCNTCDTGCNTCLPSEIKKKTGKAF